MSSRAPGPSQPHPRPNAAPNDSIQAASDLERAAGAKKAGKSRTLLIALVSVLTAAAIFLGIWWLQNHASVKAQPELQEQFAKLKEQTPNGEVYALYFIEGPNNPSRENKTADWLKIYWLTENGESATYTEHPYDLNTNGATPGPVEVAGLVNQPISDADLQLFEEFYFKVDCAEGAHRSAVMFMLSDGTPMLSGKCVTGLSVPQPGGSKFTIDGQEFNPAGNRADRLRAFFAQARHMDVKFARILFSPLGMEREDKAYSCLQWMGCAVEYKLPKQFEMPTYSVDAQGEVGADQWMSNKTQPPAGIPSGFLNFDTLDAQKIHDCLTKAENAGYKSDFMVELSLIQRTDTSFALVWQDIQSGELKFIDEDGNVFN